MNILNFIIKFSLRKFLNLVFRKNFTIFYAILIIAFILFCSYTKAFAYDYEYKGVYSAQSVFLGYCDTCYLRLPPEYLASQLVLSISTDDQKSLLKAIISASRASGWELKKQGQMFIAEPIQNEGNLVYLSKVTNEPVNVPKYLYYYSKLSDSLKYEMMMTEKFTQDSIKHYTDSVAAYKEYVADSLAKITLPFVNYELRYYSFTQAFSQLMGTEYGSVLAEGNLHDKFKVFDDWKIHATETNDTTFTFRRVNLTLDSTINIDWGTEEQNLKSSFISDGGVVSNDYEWRKYGLIIQITKDNRLTKLSYTFRDKENAIALLQGSAVGELADTIQIRGEYNSVRSIVSGVPFLSRLPVVGYLFSTTTATNDIRIFELYLIPNKKGVYSYEKDTTNYVNR